MDDETAAALKELERQLDDDTGQITDAMSAWLVVAEYEGLEIAPPTPQESVKPAPGTLCSVIKANTLDYRSRTDTQATRKNVSLPIWMSQMADKE